MCTILKHIYCDEKYCNLIDKHLAVVATRRFIATITKTKNKTIKDM